MSYEIEIKVLLGEEQTANDAIAKLQKSDPSFVKVSEESQLNHYFVARSLEAAAERVEPFISLSDQEKLDRIVRFGKKQSLRTRWIAPDTTILVVKAAIDDTTSSNGIIREEVEIVIPDMTLEALDALLIEAGNPYEAMWSRFRQTFQLKDTTVTVDKNAGYGYLAEFERVIENANEGEQTKLELLAMIGSLGFEELAQDRLARMFAHYNENWRDYYGTEKVFTIL